MTEELNNAEIGFGEVFGGVDLTAVATEKVIVEAGDYKATVTAVEDKVSRDGQSRYVAVTFQLAIGDGEAIHALTENYIYAHQTKPYAAEIGFKGLCKLAAAMGFKELQRAKELEGGIVTAHVTVKTRDNGTRENHVAWVSSWDLPF